MSENNNLFFGPASAKTVKLARLWLYNAVFALAVAGLFALFPLVLRGMIFKDIQNTKRIFDIALIVHVNMSIMIWLVSVCCMVFAIRSRDKFIFFSQGAAWLAIFGTCLIAISPLIAKSIPFTNNYVPILGNIWFMLGLACFAGGALLQSVICLLSFRFTPRIDNDFARSFAAYSTALILLIAFLCFLLSNRELKVIMADFNPAEAKNYYEILFWGGGHILQFAYVQMMIFSWLWVAESLRARVPDKPGQVIFIYSFGLVMALVAPFIYIEYSVQSYELINFFTRQMQYGLGIAPLLAAVSLLVTLKPSNMEKKFRPESNALIFSVILFAAGGVIGFMIRGSNAIIPAHYHGSIVAVVLSFMALAYDILPRLGFKRALGKLASAQPVVYGAGQLMHITGLAIMGGYGALRKDAASSGQIDTVIGKALFFAGGGFAIIGGLLFVIIMAKAMWPEKGRG